MANIWEGDDYNITKIETKIVSYELDENNEIIHDKRTGTHTDLESEYYVTIQRLPASSYPSTTDVHIDRIEYFSNLLPLSITESSLVAGLLPIINTHIASYDVSFDGSEISTPDKTNFTDKTI